MNHNIYIYILVMAAVTYLIRMLPLALSRKEITSPFIKSFLYYVPYGSDDFPGNSFCNR
jgi:branched-subunit amino acid transport protein